MSKVIELPILLPGMPLEMFDWQGEFRAYYTLEAGDVAVAINAVTGKVWDVYKNIDTLRNFCTDTDLVIVPLNDEAADVLERERALYADCFEMTYP